MGEIKRRTKVIGRFPGEGSCLALCWAVLEQVLSGAYGLSVTQLDRRGLESLRRQQEEARAVALSTEHEDNQWDSPPFLSAPGTRPSCGAQDPISVLRLFPALSWFGSPQYLLLSSHKVIGCGWNTRSEPLGGCQDGPDPLGVAVRHHFGQGVGELLIVEQEKQPVLLSKTRKVLAVVSLGDIDEGLKSERMGGAVVDREDRADDGCCGVSIEFVTHMNRNTSLDASDVLGWELGNTRGSLVSRVHQACTLGIPEEVRQVRR